MLLLPPLEAWESLCITCEACIHSFEGAQVPHDHVGVIEFFINSECNSWVLYQLVSPGGGVLTLRPLQGLAGASGSLHFFLSHFMTLMLLHPPLEARESLCVTYEACIHASKGAQVPHDQVGMIEYFFYSECIFWICTN
jgi:hypothetical protein